MKAGKLFQLVWLAFNYNHLCLVFIVIFWLNWKWRRCTQIYQDTHKGTYALYQANRHIVLKLTNISPITWKKSLKDFFSEKIFRRSWQEIEKCCKLSVWANIISLKNYMRYHVWMLFVSCCNNCLTLRTKTVKHRVE